MGVDGDGALTGEGVVASVSGPELVDVRGEYRRKRTGFDRLFTWIYPLGGLVTTVATVARYARGGPLMWFPLVIGLFGVLYVFVAVLGQRTVVQPEKLRVRSGLIWEDIPWGDVRSVEPAKHRGWTRDLVAVTSQGQTVLLFGFPFDRDKQLMTFAREHARAGS